MRNEFPAAGKIIFSGFFGLGEPPEATLVPPETLLPEPILVQPDSILVPPASTLVAGGTRIAFGATRSRLYSCGTTLGL